MDDILGIGLPELIFILVLAGLFLKPQQIRGVARTFGRFVAQMQGIMLDFRRQINAELDALDDTEMKEAIADLRQLQREVEELRRQVIPQQLIDESRRAAADVERSFKPRSQVPPEAAAEPAPAEAPVSLPRAVDVPEDPEV
jgi:sec-independent protein translocase protein TatB